MTTCSITEDAATHNLASITPTPEQTGTEDSKKNQPSTGFTVMTTPSQTPPMECSESQCSNQNMAHYSLGEQRSTIKRKYNEMGETEEEEPLSKKNRVLQSRSECVRFASNIGLGLSAEKLLLISSNQNEFDPDHFDFNFGATAFIPSSGQNSPRRCTSVDYSQLAFGVSNPNSRSVTPLNIRGISYHLPGLIGNLGESDLTVELSQQRNHDYQKEAFLVENRSCTYLIKHNMINKVMRWLVVNWMHQVAHEHRLKRQTFHLAVNYFDIYLSKDANFPPDSLFQLLGATALIAASKVEEEEPPLSDTLCEFMLDPNDPSMNAAYLDDSKKKLFDLEFKMFKKFGWELSFHTAHDFMLSYFQLLRIKKPELPDEDVDLSDHVDIGNPNIILTCRIHVALFVKASNALADAVADYDCLKYSNSILASAMFSFCYESVLNDNLLEEITGYKQSTLSEAMLFAFRYWNEASTDLSADYPDYGDVTLKYDYVHHQAQTYKTCEAMEGYGEN